jgi:hypothetical protein
MRYVLLAALLSLSTTAFPAPTIFWASDPVRPDETVVLLTDGASPTSTVDALRLPDARATRPGASSALPATWTSLRPLQSSRPCVKAVVPSTWKPGVFALRVRDGAQVSPVVLANAPDPWWLQGDEGQRATPGGWLRVLGKCLSTTDARIVLRDTHGADTPLKLTSATTWSLGAALPSSLQPGDHEVFVHNGQGGDSAWKSAGKLTIIPPVAWKTDVLTVASPVEGVDTDKAIRAALDKARKNGGGIVLLRRGTYDVQGEIPIPPGTVLKGEAPGLVTLYWKNTPDPPEALISGHDYGLQNLTIFAFNYHCVISDNPDSERLRLDHVVLRAVPDAARSYVLKSNAGFLAAIRLQGRNFQVTHCDIYAAVAGNLPGRSIVTGPWGFDGDRGPYYGVISDCVLDGHLYGCENLRGLIFERNRVKGVAVGASTYWTNFSCQLYAADNIVQHVYGGDREIMTSDASGGAYFGRASVSGTHLTLAADPIFTDAAPTHHTDYRGAAIYLLDGTGAGQWRTVTANRGREWEVDRPWDVPPDDTTLLSIVPFRGRTLIVNNDFSDGGALQMYGTVADVVIAGNKGARIDGMFAWGLNPGGVGWQPCFTTQFLDNEITEGSGYGARVWGDTFLGVITGDSNDTYPGPLARGNILRRNVLQTSSFINLGGVSRDTLVEGCTIKHHSTGIKIDRDVQGVVLRHNHFEDVAAPITGPGAPTALIISSP